MEVVDGNHQDGYEFNGYDLEHSSTSSLSSMTATTTTTIRELHLPESDYYVLEPSEISSLSDTQEKVLTLIPMVSGLLSIIGSSTIVYMAITKQRRKRRQMKNGRRSHDNKNNNNNRDRDPSWTPYTRLILGMSVLDIISSLTLMVTPFLLPSDTSQRVWAFGNDRTCTMLGFFQQLSISGFLYNAFLSFYFVLTVRFGITNTTLSKCFEPIMHIISIGFPLITASIGAAMGIFHELELGQTCWVSNYPHNCEFEGPECKSEEIAWIYGGIALVFAFLTIPINNFIIYIFVQKQVRISHQSLQKKVSVVRRRKTNTSLTDVEDSPRRSRCSLSLDGSNEGSSKEGDNERGEFDVEDLRHQKEEEDRHLRRRQESEQQTSKEQQLKRLKLVSTQTFLYVPAFFACTSWMFIIRVMESISFNAEDEADLFWMLVLQAWFFPLQGFFNVLIYMRPKYIKHRRQFPNETRLWAMRRSVFGSDIAPSTNDGYPIQVANHNPQAPCNNDIQGIPLSHKSPMAEREASLKDEACGKQNQSPKTVTKHPSSHGLHDSASTLPSLDMSAHLFRTKSDPVRTPLQMAHQIPIRNRYNYNVSSITLDEDDEEDCEMIQVPVQSEWRWASGGGSNHSSMRSNSHHKSFSTASCFAGGSSSLEAISELSAVSFVDPEEADENTDPSCSCSESASSTSSGNGTIPDEDLTYIEDMGQDNEEDYVIPLKSGLREAPSTYTSDGPGCLRISSTEVEEALSVDPSFDRMQLSQSLRSGSVDSMGDTPIRRPTRRLSPPMIEIVPSNGTSGHESN